MSSTANYPSVLQTLFAARKGKPCDICGVPTLKTYRDEEKTWPCIIERCGHFVCNSCMTQTFAGELPPAGTLDSSTPTASLFRLDIIHLTQHPQLTLTGTHWASPKSTETVTHPDTWLTKERPCPVTGCTHYWTLADVKDPKFIKGSPKVHVMESYMDLYTILCPSCPEAGSMNIRDFWFHILDPVHVACLKAWLPAAATGPASSSSSLMAASPIDQLFTAVCGFCRRSFAGQGVSLAEVAQHHWLQNCIFMAVGPPASSTNDPSWDRQPTGPAWEVKSMEILTQTNGTSYLSGITLQGAPVTSIPLDGPYASCLQGLSQCTLLCQKALYALETPTWNEGITGYPSVTHITTHLGQPYSVEKRDFVLATMAALLVLCCPVRSKESIAARQCLKWYQCFSADAAATLHLQQVYAAIQVALSGQEWSDDTTVPWPLQAKVVRLVQVICGDKAAPVREPLTAANLAAFLHKNSLECQETWWITEPTVVASTKRKQVPIAETTTTPTAKKAKQKVEEDVVLEEEEKEVPSKKKLVRAVIPKKKKKVEEPVEEAVEEEEEEVETPPVAVKKAVVTKKVLTKEKEVAVTVEKKKEKAVTVVEKKVDKKAVAVVEKKEKAAVVEKKMDKKAVVADKKVVVEKKVAGVEKKVEKKAPVVVVVDKKVKAPPVAEKKKEVAKKKKKPVVEEEEEGEDTEDEPSVTKTSKKTSPAKKAAKKAASPVTPPASASFAYDEAINQQLLATAKGSGFVLDDDWSCLRPGPPASLPAGVKQIPTYVAMIVLHGAVKHPLQMVGEVLASMNLSLYKDTPEEQGMVVVDLQTSYASALDKSAFVMIPDGADHTRNYNYPAKTQQLLMSKNKNTRAKWLPFQLGIAPTWAKMRIFKSNKDCKKNGAFADKPIHDEVPIVDEIRKISAVTSPASGETAGTIYTHCHPLIVYVVRASAARENIELYSRLAVLSHGFVHLNGEADRSSIESFEAAILPVTFAYLAARPLDAARSLPLTLAELHEDPECTALSPAEIQAQGAAYWAGVSESEAYKTQVTKRPAPLSQTFPIWSASVGQKMLASLMRISPNNQDTEQQEEFEVVQDGLKLIRQAVAEWFVPIKVDAPKKVEVKKAEVKKVTAPSKSTKKPPVAPAPKKTETPPPASKKRKAVAAPPPEPELELEEEEKVIPEEDEEEAEKPVTKKPRVEEPEDSDEDNRGPVVASTLHGLFAQTLPPDSSGPDASEESDEYVDEED